MEETNKVCLSKPNYLKSQIDEIFILKSIFKLVHTFASADALLF